MCIRYLYDIADDLSGTDEKGDGRPKQVAREVQADFVAVEVRNIVCRHGLARPPV